MVYSLDLFYRFGQFQEPEVRLMSFILHKSIIQFGAFFKYRKRELKNLDLGPSETRKGTAGPLML